MFKRLKQRAGEQELMDDLATGGAELREALQHLRRLNRIFGAAAPTLYGVQRIWQEEGRPAKLSILDIGSGSGDVNRHLLRWAEEHGIDMHITLTDITEEACAEARLLFQDEPRIQVKQGDLFELQSGCADVVTGTQFVHHFASDELPNVVESMLSASRLGVVINDIHRHWIAWAAVWLMAHMVSTNRYIRNDGPLSVAKGFRAEDWRNLRDTLHNPDMSYSWRPLFRYAVMVRKRGDSVETKSG